MYERIYIHSGHVIPIFSSRCLIPILHHTMKVGDKVYNKRHGIGRVVEVFNLGKHNILIEFKYTENFIRYLSVDGKGEPEYKYHEKVKKL